MGAGYLGPSSKQERLECTAHLQQEKMVFLSTCYRSQKGKKKSFIILKAL
jgi:hypothetical protein